MSQSREDEFRALLREMIAHGRYPNHAAIRNTSRSVGMTSASRWMAWRCFARKVACHMRFQGASVSEHVKPVMGVWRRDLLKGSDLARTGRQA